jgi:hypothetical protein
MKDMRTKDYLACGIALFGLFLLCLNLDGFIALTRAAPYGTSFLKFAVLATFGECIGLRIVTGDYNRPGFGILPKALVWGVLGVGIKTAFTIFAAGAPAVLAELGLPISATTLKSGDFFPRLLAAFFISVTMNSIFAPLFMILHKVSDLHIAETGGTLRGFLTPIPMGRLLKEIPWDVMWGLVFKKTLPCFWLPAHTITFMLPQHFQVVFAALLGVVLGVILAIAGMKKSGAEAVRAFSK